MSIEYRIQKLSNGKYAVDKRGRVFGWNRCIMAQQGSMIIPLNFDTLEDAEKFINNQPNNETTVKKVIK